MTERTEYEQIRYDIVHIIHTQRDNKVKSCEEIADAIMKVYEMKKK